MTSEREIRSRCRRIPVAAALLLSAIVGGLATLALPASAASPKAYYELVGMDVNPGPLKCYPAGGMLLDWTKIPSSEDDVDPASDESPQRKDGAVKYSVAPPGAGRGSGAVGWWTRPRFISEAETLYMELYATKLMGNPASFRVQVKANYGDGVTMAILTEGQGEASAAVRFPVTDWWPPLVKFTVGATNGGVCGDKLVTYSFEKREN